MSEGRDLEHDLKHDIEPVRHDVDIGQMLAVEATPEEERRVLRKLDCLYVILANFCNKKSSVIFTNNLQV